MLKYHTLAICFLSLFISACNQQDQSARLDTAPADKPDIQVQATAPVGQALPETHMPALKLTIDDITSDQDAPFADLDFDSLTASETDEPGSQMNSKKDEQRVKLSGKVFTDQTRIENKEYLQSVDGLQLNIEGKFN